MERIQEHRMEQLAEQYGRLAVRTGYSDQTVRVTEPCGRHFIIGSEGIVHQGQPDYSIDWSK